MKSNISNLNKKAITYYMLVLLVFFLILNFLVIDQQRRLLISEYNRFIKNEITFFSKLTTTSLLIKDYANIEASVSEWGEDSTDVVSITLTADNGFVIADFQRDIQVIYPMVYQQKLEYGPQSSATLKLTVSQDEMHQQLLGIAIKLISGSIVLVVLFGLVSWRILRKTAISPLQTEIKQHEETSLQLHEAKQAAEKANRSKSEFLANMSHEIRTPMNGVLGMLSLLLDTRLSDKQYDYAKTAYNSGETLLTILNDILDFSKIEAGKLEIESLAFNPYELIEETTTLMASAAQKKHLELAFHIDPEIPRRILGDASRIRQILTNLISNAIKFTEAGEVIIKTGIDNNDNMINIKVIDTGIGIPQEKQGNIFNAFEQADSSTTRIYGGTGLGLAICNKLSELMQGKMKLEQSTPEGSVFSFSFPRLTDSEPETHPHVHIHEELIGKHILILDDNATNRKILEQLAEQWQLKHHSADSASIALTLVAKAHQQNQPFDIILTDMMMPEINGNEFTELLKSDPRNANIPIILLTSLQPDSETGNKLIQRKQFQNILMKPVRHSLLFNAILEAINCDTAQQQAEEINQPEPVRPFQGHTAIIAEDNITNQRVAEGMLKKLGFDYSTTANGKEAVEALQNQAVDIIFMDCQMPEMDGYEASRVIRELPPPLNQTIIIAMTANAMPEDRGKCLLAGMNDYIAKPLKYENIEQAASRWIATNASEPLEIFSETTDTELLDANTIDALKSIIEDNYRHIVEEFYNNTVKIIEQIRNNQSDLGADAQLKQLHTLKGSSANIGASRLSLRILQLEQALKQSPGTDLTNALDEIHDLLEQTMTAFKKIL